VLDCGRERLELVRGNSVLVPAGLPYTIRGRGDGKALLYRASVP